MTGDEWPGPADGAEAEYLRRVGFGWLETLARHRGGFSLVNRYPPDAPEHVGFELAARAVEMDKLWCED